MTNKQPDTDLVDQVQNLGQDMSTFSWVYWSVVESSSFL